MLGRQGENMANRSYLYLENPDGEIRFLCEAAAVVPDFWQCFWSGQELERAVEAWLAAGALSEDDDGGEDAVPEGGFADIRVSQAGFQSYSRRNRRFIRQHFSDGLDLYDALVRYVEANMQENDMLCFDVEEVVCMCEMAESVAEFFDNQRALSTCSPKFGHFLFDSGNMIAYSTGWPDYFADDLNSRDRLDEAQAYRCRLKTADSPVGELTGKQKRLIEAVFVAAAIALLAATWHIFGRLSAAFGM